MAANNVPLNPQLPAPGSPGYEQLLNRQLYDLLRKIALKLDELEKRIAELEP